MKFKVKLDLPSATQLVRSLGLEADGDVQRFHTKNVLKRVKAYMPYLSGELYELTVAQTDIDKPEIVTIAPQAGYLYRGKKMVNSKTGKGPANIPGVGLRYRKGTILKATRTPLNYTKTKNPKAGPQWGKNLVASEGDAITADLQQYIERRKRS